MKTTFLYNDLLKFDQSIQMMVSHSDVLKCAETFVFCIYTQANGKNAYHYKIGDESTIERMRTLVTPDVLENALFSEGNIQCVVFNSFLEDDDVRTDYFEVALVSTNTLNRDQPFVGCVYITIDKSYRPVLEVARQRKYNFLLIDFLMHYIQLEIENYEKLYYLIDFFSELISVKDLNMPYHMTNVANWSMLIANELNLKYEEQLVLYVAALIHDVGKIYIPDNIINKATKLTDEEYEQVKVHSERGYEITNAALYGMHYFSQVPNIIKHHHERFDGNGYPARLKGHAIPLLSRIIAVADAVDAMMSRRAYRDLLSEDFIIKEILRGSGKQFDPDIANVMIELIQNRKKENGSHYVEDSNFIPQTSLNFFYDNFKNQQSYLGNLIIHKQTGKLIIHSEDSFFKLDLNRIYKPSISFFAFHDFLEYEIEIIGTSNNQVLISEFKYVPTDKYFSLIWELTGLLKTALSKNEVIKIIKVGGDTLVFEVKDQGVKERLISCIDKNATLDFTLEVEDIKKHFSLLGRIIRFFKFQSVTVFVFKYTNINSVERDSILRLLFRKQMHDRKLRG